MNVVCVRKKDLD